MGEPGGLPSMGSHKVGHDSSDLAARVEIMASGSVISWQIDGETMETVTLFWGAPKSLQMMVAAMKLKDASSLEEKL